MRLPGTAAAAAITLALLLAGCSTAPSDESPTPAQTEAASPSQSVEPTAAPSSGTPESPSADQGVVGTVGHFTSGDAVVEVVIDEDNPITRSFFAMLPMTLVFSDYGGKEKVATPAGEWNFTDAQGLNPEVGDLFSSRIGETEDIDRIELLDGQQVTIDIAG